ncbi:MAG: hypothetical protein PHI68_02175 [Candidatus Cloacimonetes bacterium]|nr:hypothetical protein [Candidatus Cloacimonadota bacterium]
MKLTPSEEQIMARMQPGVITLNGFLGFDTRNLNEIIADDEKVLEMLGISAEELAERMQYFSDKTFESYDLPVLIDEIYEVETNIVRGKLPCPFRHPGIYRKTITTLTNRKQQITVRWTALSIHTIKEHHFFEGKGSPFRLDPQILKKALLD